MTAAPLGRRGAGREARTPERSPETARTRATVAGLAAVWIIVCAVAWGVRWPAMHPGGDNAGYLSLAAALAFEGHYAETWTPGSPPHAKYPPVYPAVLAAMMLAGAESWDAFKAASALSVGLAAAFAFLWARRSEGFAVAIAVALAFGLSPSALDASRWIWSDTLFAALTFSALWALTPPRLVRTDSASPSEASHPGNLSAWWLAGGLALVGLAYFTRSAGLPLVVTAAICIALARRWRALAAFALCFLPFAALWGSRSGGQAYGSEFWLIDMYDPGLGTFGAAEFLQRVAANVRTYVTSIVPYGLAAWRGTWAVVGGVALAALAVGGWVRRLRRSVGPAEVFMPLYAALLFAWPHIGAAARYALPLLPVLLLYAAEALRSLAGRLRVPPAAAVAAGGLAVAVPAVWSASGTMIATVEEAPACRFAPGPVACAGRAVAASALLGAWAAQHLPDDAVVMARKPRIFHLFSGLPSVPPPFYRDDDGFFAFSADLGVRHVVLDLGFRDNRNYLLPTIERNPDRFCIRQAVETEPDFHVRLLEITEPGGPGRDAPPGTVGWCRDVPVGAIDWTTLASMKIPLVERARITR